MSTVKKLIKSIYRGLKSDERARKAVKAEGKLSKKPVDPAEQRYKQQRRIERSENKVYDEDWDSFEGTLVLIVDMRLRSKRLLFLSSLLSFVSL